MSDPMTCMDCRSGWLDFRARLGEAGIPPERRGEVIKEYLRLFHLYDHDEDRVRAHVEESAREFVLRSLVEQARDWIAGAVADDACPPPSWGPRPVDEDGTDAAD